MLVQRRLNVGPTVKQNSFSVLYLLEGGGGELVVCEHFSSFYMQIDFFQVTWHIYISRFISVFIDGNRKLVFSHFPNGCSVAELY